MARSRLRVVWATGDVIATFSPTSWFTRVDLPTLGLPISAMKPERWFSDDEVESMTQVCAVTVPVSLCSSGHSLA